MSLQVNNNSGIIPAEWQSLLAKAGVTATQSVDNKPALTFTATVDGVERQVTVNIPDDLELPATFDQAAVDSLCAKLAADSSLGATPEQIADLHAALTAVLRAPGVASSISGLPNSKSIMFDLYKLMALLVEVAQKQRDSSRELRQAESQQIQTSIQNQADIQHRAAVISMAASALCCIAQGVAMGISLYKQASAFKTQLAGMETSGVGNARQNFSMLKAGETANGAAKQFNTIKSSVGEETANRVADSFTQAGIDKNYMQARDIRINQNTAKLQRLQNLQRPLDPQDVPQGSALEQAQTRLNNFHELQDLKAVQNPTEQQTARLNELQPQFENVTEEQLTNELNQARTNAATEVQQTIQQDQTAREQYRTSANTKFNAALKTYEQAYDTAVRDRAEIAPNASKAEIERVDQNLEKASADLKFARAYVANERIDITTAEERQALTMQAETRLMDSQNLLKGDTSYIKAGHVLQRGEATNQLITAVGNCVQNIISSANQMMQADATKLGAEQERRREDLEQIKDLFSQAKDLVDAVVQLMQAVSSAETQSMRDAIQA